MTDAVQPNAHDTALQPITEADIANFLLHTPDFFERHADLLANVELSSPHGGRTVSLQERQAEMLRDKIKMYERRIMDMMNHGNENMLTAQRLQRWAQQLLQTADDTALPGVIVRALREQFLVPQVALKVWDVAPAHAALAEAQGASDDVKTLATSLTSPYCGVNADFEVAKWLDAPEAAQSIAMLPLRQGHAPQAFGLLVLASPDAQRFHAGMGTDFLEQLAELASAALSRLR